MSSERDEGPVYYREIQKNAYLKRIPNESSSSKLLPLGHKKPPLKAMWTLFCVHNGRVPYLEQYPEAESSCTAAHKPVWRASLSRARHVSGSLRPRMGQQYDFLIDTDNGPVRMLAPDWDTMQDWVSTLRCKLHELKILAKGENVYCAPPAPAPPRLAARDPTSPLPPTPPVPPDRVPGIELTPIITRTTQSTQPDPPETNPTPTTQTEPTQPEPDSQPIPTEDIDISSWEPDENPSTSNTPLEPKKSVAKICGQNICLDDSILKRNVESTDSDEEFFAEIDRLNDSVEDVGLEDGFLDYKQRVVVNESKEDAETAQSDRPTNITVIQVSNKGPHTAIPVMGPETTVFKFDFKQNVPVTDGITDFVNIVNTEANINEDFHNYGTVFTKESDYGHISLTTTVNLTGEGQKENENGIYERLCMASTSNNENYSPLPLRKLKNVDKIRKSSLPNLDTSSDSTYEYLYPNNNKNTTVTLNSGHHSLVEVNSNVASVNDVTRSDNNDDSNIVVNGVTRSTTNSDTSRTITTDITRLNSENTRTINSDSRIHNSDNRVVNNSENRLVTNVNRMHTNLASSVSIGNVDSNSRVLRTNVDRSHSQNAYDRVRAETARTGQDVSTKKDCKTDKCGGERRALWRRGLTELSLLSRLRARTHNTHANTNTNTNEAVDRNVTSPVKVVTRSRGETRDDSARRRSSSLSNGQSSVLAPPLSSGAVPAGALIPLRARQAASLRAELRRGAAIPAAIPTHHPPVFADYDGAVWIARWGGTAVVSRAGGRCGDRVAALRGAPPAAAAHAASLVSSTRAHTVDILFHRVPLAKVYVINKRDRESIGIKLDNECNITCVEPNSPAARAGVPPPGKWAVTEVNNRPVNIVKGGVEEVQRLSALGTEVLVLLQPSPLVNKLRRALRSAK